MGGIREASLSSRKHNLQHFEPHSGGIVPEECTVSDYLIGC